MATRKARRTVEITLKVTIPAWMTVSMAKHVITQQWYGDIDDTIDTGDRYRDITLRPRWGKARLAK